MNAYAPRPGSKVELAVNELKPGPRSVEALARVLSVKKSNVAVLLSPACRHGYLRQFNDEQGVPHWVLARNPASADTESPSRVLPGWPQVRSIVTHAPPSDEARRYADPFGRTRRWQAQA